ncbi:MAG: carbamoyltransferase HypF, partial [Candidatus Hadarchaeales archaeon]
GVTGVVQGVGFRPFVYRLAQRYGLLGFVRNMGDAGVQIVVEGGREEIEEFLSSLRREAPPLSRIEEVRVKWTSPTGEFRSFKVEESRREGLGGPSVIPPDLAVCKECTREMLNPMDRRYAYPFTTCVDCGPRFTVILDLPYDRERTSMVDFPLCPACLREYTNPSDRRYHAETTCCPSCGPSLELHELHEGGGKRLEVRDPLRETARLLDEGFIVGIKGIGGTHLACRTVEDEPLRRLRATFRRPQQPFAVMSRDLETVRTFAQVSEEEARELTSHRRPIVILKRSRDFPLSELVSPGLDSVGVMLPYSGIHLLLLHHGREPAYVMTSANPPGLPMIVENEKAFRELRGKVDYLLLHNRRIVNRCDDSVLKVVEGEAIFLRRSRGYVPEPIILPFSSEKAVLGVGAEENVTASFLLGNRCFPSQHIGDTGKLETLAYLREAVASLGKLLRVERVEAVAHDLNPLYPTTRLAGEWAEEWGAERVGVQHHHAHLCSLMAEGGVEEMVGIACDGAGYGTDGTVWGGEVMVADFSTFERAGGLQPQPMPGGDAATKFPARMVAGILWRRLGREETERILAELCPAGFPKGEREREVVLRQLERGHLPLTSSCGRVLDAISCLLGLCWERTYEGEPAMKLEAAAGEGDPDTLRLPCERSGKVVDTSSLLEGVVEAMRKRVPRKHVAASAHKALALALAEVACETAEEKGIEVVGVSGGVFCNRYFTVEVRREVERRGLSFLRHKLLPPGDGGISVGQAVSAAQRLRTS